MTLELALPDSTADIDRAADPALYVALACERAKAWLANALQHGEIERIVELRSQAEAIRIYTQQKEVGKDAELSAAEIVRRAERGIHLAVESARERGDLLRPGQTVRRPGHHVDGENMVRTLADVGLDRATLANTAGLADGVSDEAFEEALSEARTEGNLARANVVRKARGLVGGYMTRAQKADKIREMAGEGYSSRQMESKLATAAGTIREIAREHGIDIPADRVTARTKHIDPQRVVQETVNTLQGIEYGLNLLNQADYDTFTSEQVRGWLGQLNTPARAIRVLLKELNARV